MTQALAIHERLGPQSNLANTLNTICIMWMFNEESMISKENVRLFAPDFARGTPPTSDASMSPAWDEVKALYKDNMTAVIQRVEKLTDDQLPNPMSEKTPEPLRAYFSSIGASLNIGKTMNSCDTSSFVDLGVKNEFSGVGMKWIAARCRVQSGRTALNTL